MAPMGAQPPVRSSPAAHIRWKFTYLSPLLDSFSNFMIMIVSSHILNFLTAPAIITVLSQVGARYICNCDLSDKLSFLLDDQVSQRI